MSDTKEQILSFIDACNELKKCKFIMATERIRDVLKCIVNSPDLYNLINTSTKDFNYLQAKSQCLLYVSDGVYRRNILVMPQSAREIIAFTFCLLVEFDNNSMDFNEFLRRYFPEDGSYFASFHAFCNTVINAFKDAVAEVYKEELEKSDITSFGQAVPNPEKANMLSAIEISVSSEKQFIATNEKIPEEEKEGAFAILSQLYGAVKAGDRQLITALVCGYNYFVLYYGCISEGVAELLRLITEYERL